MCLQFLLSQECSQENIYYESSQNNHNYYSAIQENYTQPHQGKQGNLYEVTDIDIGSTPHKQQGNNVKPYTEINKNSANNFAIQEPQKGGTIPGYDKVGAVIGPDPYEEVGGVLKP